MTFSMHDRRISLNPPTHLTQKTLLHNNFNKYSTDSKLKGCVCQFYVYVWVETQQEEMHLCRWAGAFQDEMFHVMQFGEIYAGLFKNSRHNIG